MSAANRFGIGFESIGVRRQIECAQMAERLGFGSCWVPEDYFFRGAFTIASALACSTSRIRIGLGVVNPFTRHPALIAMEFAALSELAAGRAILGIGSGVRAWLNQMHLGDSSASVAIREAVEIIRRVTRGESVTFDGKIFQTDRVALSFKPADPEVPIHLGVMGPKNLQMAGRIADGVMLSALTSPAYARFAIDRISEGAQVVGRSAPLEVGAFLLASIGEDERKARDAVKPLLAVLLTTMSGEAEHPIFAAAGIDPDEVRRFGSTYSADGAWPIHLVTDPMIDTFTIAGAPDRCRTALEQIIDAGVTHPVFLEVVGTPIEETIQAVHQHLMPHFQ